MTPRRPRRSTAALLSLGLVGTTAAVLSSATAPASAAAGDGSLTVQVIRDMGANGTYDSLIDLPLDGVTVKVSDSNGNTVKLTTDADGKATLPAGDTRLKGGQYRVDVANPDKSYYKPAFASTADPATTPSATDLSSNQEFVDVSGGTDATVTTGFWHPRDYCQSNPQVANACQPGMFSHGVTPDDAETSPRDTVFLTNYNDSAYENIAKSAAGSTDVGAGSVGTGSVFGIAYNRLTKKVFSAAYAKRNVDYGDAGPGGVYITDPATKKTTVFTTVPDAGNTQHDLTSVSNGGHEDAAFRKAVGKESLGAIVMSEDYKSLFVLNLNNKKVYVYDATGNSAAAPKRTIDVSDHTVPGCPTANDWRPTGLGEQDGTLYVGGVCSGEDEATPAAPQPSTMKAIVWSFNETSGASNGVIMDAPLDFVRSSSLNTPCVSTPAGTSSWLGWSDDLPCSSAPSESTGGISVAPQPMLNKIIVEPNGDLDLAFRDRNADMYGRGLAAYMQSAPATEIHPTFITAGSLNRACKDTSGAYVMDSNGGCGVAKTDPVSTFYDQHGLSPHGLSMFAGMTRSRAEAGLVSDNMDATGEVVTNGLSVRSNATGALVPGTAQKIDGASGQYNPPTNGFGKGAGLADMDVLCDLAPVQIGNRVWMDTNQDGVQGPDEPMIPGATVNLYDASGNLVATTTTNDRGEYYFDSLKDGLKVNTKYTVRLDNPADYKKGGALAGLDLTKANQGSDEHDSDGKQVAGYPRISLKTGDHGEDNHSYDFGFTQTPKIHIVKFDGRRAGPPNPKGILGHDNNKSKPTVYKAKKKLKGRTGKKPVKMVVTNTGATPLGKVKITDKRLHGPKMKHLTCDFSKLGGPKSGTKWSGPFQPGDSFPCHGRVNLRAGQLHGDNAKVRGVQLDPNTGKRVKGVPPVKDSDKYWAKTKYRSKVTITKRDKVTKKEADTRAHAMRFKRNETRWIQMPARNVGTAPLRHVKISDRSIRGPKVYKFRCTLPSGRVIKANRHGVIRWGATFGKDPHLWLPGQVLHCRAKLHMRAGARPHKDRVRITALAPHGRHLHASDPFNATVPRKRNLLHPPNTGARSGA